MNYLDLLVSPGTSITLLISIWVALYARAHSSCFLRLKPHRLSNRPTTSPPHPRANRDAMDHRKAKERGNFLGLFRLTLFGRETVKSDMARRHGTVTRWGTKYRENGVHTPIHIFLSYHIPLHPQSWALQGSDVPPPPSRPTILVRFSDCHFPFSLYPSIVGWLHNSPDHTISTLLKMEPNGEQARGPVHRLLQHVGEGRWLRC